MARRARRERMTEAFDAFHAAMGAVLGAAENLGGAAARAHAETMAEMWLRDVGIDAARVDPGLADVLTNPALADAVGRVARDRDTAFAGWCDGDDSGPRRLDGLVAETAPRSAGKADGWLDGRHGRAPRPRAPAVADRDGHGRRRLRGVPGRAAAARRRRTCRSAGTAETRAAARGDGRVAAHAGGRLLPAGAGRSCTSGTSVSSPGRCRGSTR